MEGPTDRALIRSLVEERGGYPAHEPKTESQGDRGLLRAGFRDRDEDLKELTWGGVLREFEGKDLAFVYTEDGSGLANDRPAALKSARTCPTGNGAFGA